MKEFSISKRCEKIDFDLSSTLNDFVNCLLVGLNCCAKQINLQSVFN